MSNLPNQDQLKSRPHYVSNFINKMTPNISSNCFNNEILNQEFNEIDLLTQKISEIWKNEENTVINSRKKTPNLKKKINQNHLHFKESNYLNNINNNFSPQKHTLFESSSIWKPSNFNQKLNNGFYDKLRMDEKSSSLYNSEANNKNFISSTSNGRNLNDFNLFRNIENNSINHESHSYNVNMYNTKNLSLTNCDTINNDNSNFEGSEFSNNVRNIDQNLSMEKFHINKFYNNQNINQLYNNFLNNEMMYIPTNCLNQINCQTNLLVQNSTETFQSDIYGHPFLYNSQATENNPVLDDFMKNCNFNGQPICDINNFNNFLSNDTINPIGNNAQLIFTEFKDNILTYFTPFQPIPQIFPLMPNIHGQIPFTNLAYSQMSNCINTVFPNENVCFLPFNQCPPPNTCFQQIPIQNNCFPNEITANGFGFPVQMFLIPDQTVIPSPTGICEPSIFETNVYNYQYQTYDFDSQQQYIVEDSQVEYGQNIESQPYILNGISINEQNQFDINGGLSNSGCVYYLNQ